MNRDHRIIAICGADAVGKHTQTALLAKRLNATLIDFPNYDSPTGKLIKAHLHKEWVCASKYEENLGYNFERTLWRPIDSKLDAMVFQTLMTANRYESLPRIREALKVGHVVFDRYFLSGVVYGAAAGLDRDWVRSIQSGLPEPDAWILLDAPVEEGFKRRPERRDRHETDRPFLEKVRVEYLRAFGWETAMWDRSGGWSNTAPDVKTGYGNHFIVNALGSVRDVEVRICAALRGRFGRDFLDDKELYDAEGRVKP